MLLETAVVDGKPLEVFIRNKAAFVQYRIQSWGGMSFAEYEPIPLGVEGVLGRNMKKPGIQADEEFHTRKRRTDMRTFRPVHEGQYGSPYSSGFFH